MEGVIIAIHGDVAEVGLREGLPNINNACTVKTPDKTSNVLEGHEHTSSTTAKTSALGFTEGLKRGMAVMLSRWFALYPGK